MAPSTPNKDQSWKDTIKEYYAEIPNFSQPVLASLSGLSNEAIMALTVAGTIIATLNVSRIYGRYIRRIPTVDDVNYQLIHYKPWIKGVVTSVGDADNFRLYHTPGLGWRWPLKFRFIPKTPKKLKDQTIHIRMAGVDAPEAAHFGKPAQPYSAEALEWLRSQVLGKRVKCQLLSKDQYKRIVAVPMVKSRIPFKWNCVSLMMLKAGWATVYDQSGAEYGKWGKDHFDKVLAGAQKSKRGMWAQGTSGETPAEYKKRYAAMDPTTRT